MTVKIEATIVPYAIPMHPSIKFAQNPIKAKFNAFHNVKKTITIEDLF